MSDPAIVSVRARRVWDSRALPTVEVEVHTAGGAVGRAIAPAGASRGRLEVTDRRDGGAVLGGRDVTAAVGAVGEVVAPALVGRSVLDQAGVDACLDALDPSGQREQLGGNTTVAVSLAVWHAGAAHDGSAPWQRLGGRAATMPRPEIQIMGGGAHAARRMDVQDYLVIPMSATTMEQALLDVAAVYHAVGELLAERGLRRGVADEGGFWPQLAGNEHALIVLVEGIERAGLVPGTDVALSIDVAASEFSDAGRYRLAADGRELDRDGWLEELIGWVDRYPIVAVEDPVEESDDEGMAVFTAAVGERALVIGDDYLVTRAERIQRAAALGAANAALIKVNQIGTLSAAAAAVAAGREHGFTQVVSARSGETEDVSVAHLAVGWDAEVVKVGSIARGERTAKWNELLRIAEALGDPPLAGLGIGRRSG